MKKFSLFALLLCTAAAPALALDPVIHGHPTPAGMTPGHYADGIDTAQNGNFISGSHPNAQTKSTDAPQVKGKEGERRTYKGRDLVFHDGQWHEVKLKRSARREASPAEGDHGVYQGRKLIFHGGQWYYDTASDSGKKTVPPTGR